MGPGHLGIGLVAKPLAPKAPLWSLLVASEALDLLSIGFIGIGMEKMAVSRTDLHGMQTITAGSIPWSHGLFMSLVWSILAGAIAYLVFHDRRASVVMGLMVFSHWVLDYVVHLPDLPLLFNSSPRLGLALWGSGPGLLISGMLEILLLAGGLAVYLRWRQVLASKTTLPAGRNHE